MSNTTLEQVLSEIRYGIGLPKLAKLTNMEINAIVLDGRIGVIPTRDELSTVLSGGTINLLIRYGCARENPEPPTLSEREKLAKLLQDMWPSIGWDRMSDSTKDHWLKQADWMIANDVRIVTKEGSDG